MKYVDLSIIVSVYNHEKYIGQALEGILKQKTKYSFEVLIGDDFSTDSTREILKQYENTYPGFFTVFYRDHNMFKEKVTNIDDLYRRSNGKYIIVLEGDDYWIDDSKIEQQVSFLEENSKYIAVAHNCIVVDENSQPTNEQYPECKDAEYTLKHYASDILPGQTATIMYRNYYKYDLLDRSLIDLNLSPGDRKKFFSVVSNGKIACVQKTMSAYRHVTESGDSFSANYYYDYDRVRHYYMEQLRYAYSLNNEEAIKCAELLYFLEIRQGLFKNRVTLMQFYRDFKKIQNPLRVLIGSLIRDYQRYITKTELYGAYW